MLNSPDDHGLPELTIRAVILGGVITVIFTAANVYLGLKSGIVFATSIPAAVISMVLLRFVSSSNIYENNIVQTVASAAGTLSNIIFVLPGLVMIGWWRGFPYWTTAAIIALGGILGVMFSVPLRRALVTGTDLPFPEGVAAAEVLRVGTASGTGDVENRYGLKVMTFNAIASSVLFLLNKTGLLLDSASYYFRIGRSATGGSLSLSLAIFGAGHLMGIASGMGIFIGIIATWGVLMPIMTASFALPGLAEDVATSVFRSDVRFFGVGVIGVAAVWTFAKILGPIVVGLRSAIRKSAATLAPGHYLPITERDLSIRVVGAIVVASFAAIGVLLWRLVPAGPLAQHIAILIPVTLVYIFVAGVIIAAIAGYMAGLFGASCSPLSGVGILAVIAAAVIVSVIGGGAKDPQQSNAMVAFALFATAFVFAIATISNDNLQDLKTGQLVGATPWRQQVALVIGVIFGAMVIPPILNVLNAVFGFAGAPGAAPTALTAPQAAIITSLAQGVLGGHLNLVMLAWGSLFGVFVIIADVALNRTLKWRLPPLAVGLGMYLPMGICLALALGGVIGHFYDEAAKRADNPQFAKRMGVLMATGLIVGESLCGVLFAGVVAGSGKNEPLALVGSGFAPVALMAGTAVFLVVLGLLYRRTSVGASRMPSFGAKS